MNQANTSQSGAIALGADASTLRRCVDLLQDDDVRTVQLRLQKGEGQTKGYGHLRLVTHSPGGWWERNGVAVRCEPEADGERVVAISLPDFAAAMAGASWAFGGSAVRLEWFAAGIRLEEHDLPALSPDEVPPMPELGPRIDRLVVPAGHFQEIVAETQLGRVRVSEALVGHLVRRGVTGAELCDVDGQPWLEAQAELRSPANTLPVTLAPLELLSVAETDVGGSLPVPRAGEERRRGSGDEVAQLLLVSNPEAPVEHLVRLLDEGVGFVRRRAAAHPNLPREVIDMLLRDGTTSIRAVAATNPSITPESVARASADETPMVRAAAAANARLPEADLVRLASDVEPEVPRQRRSQRNRRADARGAARGRSRLDRARRGRRQPALAWLGAHPPRARPGPARLPRGGSQPLDADGRAAPAEWRAPPLRVREHVGAAAACCPPARLRATRSFACRWHATRRRPPRR